MDAASSQPGELQLDPDGPTVASLDRSAAATLLPGISAEAFARLWEAADAARVDLTQAEFAEALLLVGTRYHFGLPGGELPGVASRAAFWRSLRLPEFALAQACARGREIGWQRFLALYRTPLTQAAVAITGSQPLGRELADSVYAELYGLRVDSSGLRRSPLAGYSGRGSLLGWLRVTLAQRHVDHHRRTRREAPLEAAPELVASPAPGSASLHTAHLQTAQLQRAVSRILAALPAESRFLLAAYFLDRQTLAAIGRLLHVHEATVSRQLKRLTADLRKQLLRALETGGLSRRAAEEALGTDPRDLDLNLRLLLQASQPAPFPVPEAAATLADNPSTELTRP